MFQLDTPTPGLRGSPEDYYTIVDAENAVWSAGDVINWVEESWRSLKRGWGLEKGS